MSRNIITQADVNAAREDLVNRMADAFLRYPLPDTVRADDCACILGYKGRVGTNLLTCIEARDMFRWVLEQVDNPTTL